MYTFLFVDCMYVTIRKECESKNYAVYTILGYDIDGQKDILGLWLNESESKHTWMQIFDELKGRGVEDLLFICMDGVSGLEDGAKAIFKDVVVQRCIVHLIRNSIKYVPSKDYKKFTQSIKKVYGAPSLTAARKAFEQFCQEWSQYPGAVDVWKRNFNHIEQLFDYGTAVRKIMYTTNAVESINSSFRKVTKKVLFQAKMHCSNCSISELPSFTKNGTEARAFTVFYPAYYILSGENPLFNIGMTVLIAIVMMVVGVIVWNRGIRSYESAGS